MFAFIPNLKCYNTCPNGYYGNQTDSVCYKCNLTCTSCTWSTICLSCVSAYYLQDAVCVNNCSTIPMRYANSTSMNCVYSIGCAPYYGLNSTGTCISSCPTGFFANNTIYLCQLCPITCTTCTNMTYCSSCITQSLFANNFCNPYCSSTNIYYQVNGSCTSQCPNGTYLNVLNCTICNSTCINCWGSATNCTKCNNGLYLNQQIMSCVSTCPTGYQPNSDLVCISCSSNCSTNLTFTTQNQVINGTNYVYVQFNNNVTVNGNLSNVMTLNPTNNNRRVL
jgi:proprotein convertase subtilisin/kexin type 5